MLSGLIGLQALWPGLEISKCNRGALNQQKPG